MINIYIIQIKRKTNKPGLIDIKTISGKKISYDPNNKKDYERYNPIMKKDKKTRRCYIY